MSLQEIQHFFDTHAATWDYSFDAAKLARLREIFHTYFKDIQAPVLDLGSGTGILLQILPEVLPEPHPLILEMDISLNMLLRTRERDGYFLHPSPLVQADGHSLPLKTNSVRTIVAFQVFPHFEQPARVIREALRVLQPGGIFSIVHLHDHQALNALHRRVGEEVRNHYLPPAQVVCQWLQKVGLQPEQCRERPQLYLVKARKPA